MELAELMMPVLVAKMRHARGVELVSCMLAAIEYVLPLGPSCPLAREVSLLVGQRWAEVFPHAKHYRVRCFCISSGRLRQPITQFSN